MLFLCLCNVCTFFKEKKTFQADRSDFTCFFRRLQDEGQQERTRTPSIVFGRLAGVEGGAGRLKVTFDSGISSHWLCVCWQPRLRQEKISAGSVTRYPRDRRYVRSKHCRLKRSVSTNRWSSIVLQIGAQKKSLFIFSLTSHGCSPRAYTEAPPYSRGIWSLSILDSMVW